MGDIKILLEVEISKDERPQFCTQDSDQSDFLKIGWFF